MGFAPTLAFEYLSRSMKGTRPTTKTAVSEKPIARNARATQRYEIEDKVEVGLVLTGSEVKSLRAGRCDLEGSFATITRGEVFLHGVYIGPYTQANVWGHEEKRTRKALLRRGEIEKWEGRVTMRGLTIVVLRLYFKGSFAKAELGLARGKVIGDDREKLKKAADMNEARAEMARVRGRS